MFRAADSAISGMRQHQIFIDVTGNNVANVNTDGYKVDRAMFEDRLSQIARGANITPPPQPNGAINPAMLGLGVVTRAIQGEFHQGSFITTNKPTDVAIGGAGYFVLQSGNERTYTRNGNFNLDANGTLRAGDGKTVLGVDNRPIRIPNPSATPSSFALDQRGRVLGQDARGQQVVLGQIQIARFANDAGLERIGNTDFKQTTASGAPQAGSGGTGGRGEIYAGVVEASNVDLGRELTNLILAQRGLSANSKVLSTMDELADSVNQIRR
ncbi:flagellar hook-basal body protein [Mobilicoccus pelagius]|uniref:Flagellar hook protein FlgE n=1 Tax=Mobilicoccus pelagius NBRC 104925 TaxID=1089455 RepID=H5UP79_9MICO|nr:flagellar hook-basal body complex protein [Mobilicoccus pelagius]GAB47537.1 flagellar hook protein FlgE [Mobilicoccus pelagius NBRC 104925]